MSKERELLGRWHNGDLLPEEYMKLMKETKELLAQPEQTEQKPLSDEEIADLWGDKYSGKTFMVKNFARAIEKAHGIGGE